MDQRQPPGLVVRVQETDQLLQPLFRHTRADLDTDRVGNAAEIFDVGAIDRGRAHADPREVRGQVIPAFAAVEESCLCLLVEQVQALVGRVDVRPAGFVHGLAGNGFQEVQRIRDGRDDRMVLVRHG